MRPKCLKKPDGANNAKNARIHIATYQTLGVDHEDGSANFLTTHYPEDYFSHLVIDECHRSAWGKWSEVLTRNPGAVQVGLTATPRQLVEKLCQASEKKTEPDPWQTQALPEDYLMAAEASVPYAVKGVDSLILLTKEAKADAAICADNIRYFGPAVYEYDMAQATEDGYLAACEIQKGRVNLDDTGITKAEIIARNPKMSLRASL